MDVQARSEILQLLERPLSYDFGPCRSLRARLGTTCAVLLLLLTELLSFPFSAGIYPDAIVHGLESRKARRVRLEVQR